MTQPSPKLPRGADELLQRFPAAEPDFDAQAAAITARIAAGDTSVAGGLDDLLAAPSLAAEPGEPSHGSDVRAAPAPKSNFAEMARKSLQKKDDDASLAKELLAAAAQSRRPDADMVERVRAAGRNASAGSTPLPVRSSPSAAADTIVDEAPRPSGVVARASAPEAVPAPAAAAAPANHRGTIIGIVGAAFGIAACVALFLKSGSDESASTTAAVLAAEQQADRAAARAAPRAEPVPTAVAAREPEGVVSPEALAAAPQAAATAEAAKGSTRPVPAGATPAIAASGKAAAPPSAATPEAVVLEDDPEPAAKPAPEAKPAAAEPPLKPAQGASGDVPLTPSAGAVSTALGSVRSGAQACLAGQTESVTATVTFAADGHVQRVSAAGPSAACIQAALSKAHIAPFARDSFSASITVRPP